MLKRSESKLQEELSNFHILCCQKEQSQTLFPLMLVWFFFSVGNQVLVWIPLHITDFHKHQPDKHSLADVQQGVYLSAFLLHLGDVPAGLLVFLFIDKIPRLLFLPSAILVQAFATVAIGFILDMKLFLAILPIYASLITAAHTLIWVYTPEVFPTKLRATGFGICSAVYRLAPVIAPYFVAMLFDLGWWYVTLALGSCYFIAASIATFLPKETLNVQLK